MLSLLFKNNKDVKYDIIPDPLIMQSITYHENGKIKEIIFRPAEEIEKLEMLKCQAQAQTSE